jgi:CheY-like chemotaxis protein
MDKKSVLIVDDEPSVRLLISSMLSENYAVIQASNGEEALGVAREHKPNLILMDIMMPKVDGYMACYKIKSDPKLKEIPVIMLSGIGHDLNKKLGMQFGANGYLTKPFSLQELEDIISEYL